MNDVIALTGIRGRGHHGVLEHERREGQEFVVDVSVTLDARAAGARDDLSLTVDYGGLAARVHAIIEGEPVDLIETLAERIACACLDDPIVRSADVTVHKPQAPIRVPFDDVAVRIVRHATRRAALSIGANLGDRLEALQAAVDGLRSAGTIVAVSSVYETEPVGGPEQPAYLNAVVLLDTAAEPESLLALAQSLEAAMGRRREVRWGARTLDIDLLAVGRDVIDSPGLTLPHPRCHERGFVLVPWAEVDPGFCVPGHGRVADLASAVGAAGVDRTEEALRP